MISYQMYKLLRSMPLYPDAISPDKAFRKTHLKKDRFDFLVRKAIDDDYIFYFGRNHPESPLLFLTETGVLAVEDSKVNIPQLKKAQLHL